MDQSERIASLTPVLVRSLAPNHLSGEGKKVATSCRGIAVTICATFLEINLAPLFSWRYKTQERTKTTQLWSNAELGQRWSEKYGEVTERPITINNPKEKEMTTSSEINVLKSLKKLYADSRITKNAHDIASERKKAMRYVLGISAMVLSVFVATGLVELLASDKSASIITKLLTFFSAIFAGALTFLNYETEAKTHLSAVGVYANICRSAEFLVAKAKDNLITPEETASKIDALLEQFSKANLDYQNCIPTDRDFDKARQKMKAKDESPRHNIKVKDEPQGTSA